MYRKRGADKARWLLKWSDGRWLVQDTEDKDAGNNIGYFEATTAAAKRATTPLDVPVADWKKATGEGEWAHQAGLRVRAAVGGA